MIRAADRYDVVVVGAGPAGSTAAQLLASWGWRTAVVHRETSRPSLAESLPSSTRKLLAFLGQLSCVDAAGFHPNHGNVARWADQARVARTADAGYHVSRARFDAVLRQAASAAGARQIDGVVRRVDIGDPIQIAYATADSRAALAARMVLDCSGRAGVVARHGWRRADARYRTLAVAAEWECDDWPDDERTQTLVESFVDGWAWSVPLSATRRQCTAMIDPPALAGRRGGLRRHSQPGQLQARYQHALANAAELRPRLRTAKQITAPWACDASIYDCTQAADDNVLLVGDAASFIEPLSSAGVKKALLSGWRAAVVANTCLTDRSRAGAARDLFNRREREVYAGCMRRAGAFFGEASTAHQSPFWSARADHAASANGSTSGVGDLDDEAIALDTNVRRAFEYLRATDRVRLRASASLRVEPTAAIEGREVVLRDALVVPGVEAPLCFAAGVDLPALARLAHGADDVPAVIAAYHSHVGPVPVTGLLTGLSLLVAHRALVLEGFAS